MSLQVANSAVMAQSSYDIEESVESQLSRIALEDLSLQVANSAVMAQSSIGVEESVEFQYYNMISNIPAHTNMHRLARKLARKFARDNPNTFVFFELLPSEVRLEIWSLARPEGRYIQLKVSQHGGIQAPLYSPAKVPSLLQACYESRMVACAWYKLAFATTMNQERRTYFDETRDGIYAQCVGTSTCGTHELRMVIDRYDIRLVKRIVWEGPVARLPLVRIAGFPSIRDVIIIRGRRLAPRGEVTLAEMTVNNNPLWNNNKTVAENWEDRRKQVYSTLRHRFPLFAEYLWQLQSISITRMDLPELSRFRRTDQICHRCN